jgi:hypothetical protein
MVICIVNTLKARRNYNKRSSRLANSFASLANIIGLALGVLFVKYAWGDLFI